MIELGVLQQLKVVRRTDNGVYLADPEDESDRGVLLPKNQVTDEIKLNSMVNVFVYKDSEDRPIATTTIPKIQMDELAVLKVVQVNTIGAFLDWGLAKDLLLPFKEQKNKVDVGDKVLVKLYLDKSNRLCATSKIYDLLLCDSTYKTGDNVVGTVYDINTSYGAFVAVDNKYLALIPNNDFITPPRIGTEINARVTSVRPDGKLNLSLRLQKELQMDKDAESILNKLNNNNGFLPYNDKTPSDVIKKELSLSKNAFKRAIGKLYKQKIINIADDGIHKIK